MKNNQMAAIHKVKGMVQLELGRAAACSSALNWGIGLHVPDIRSLLKLHSIAPAATGADKPKKDILDQGIAACVVALVAVMAVGVIIAKHA